MIWIIYITYSPIRHTEVNDNSHYLVVTGQQRDRRRNYPHVEKKNKYMCTVYTEAHDCAWKQKYTILFILGLIFVEVCLRNKLSIGYSKTSIKS